MKSIKITILTALIFSTAAPMQGGIAKTILHHKATPYVAAATVGAAILALNALCKKKKANKPTDTAKAEVQSTDSWWRKIFQGSNWLTDQEENCSKSRATRNVQIFTGLFAVCIGLHAYFSKK